MKINLDNFPILSLLKSLFTDSNKARVAGQMDEIRRFFIQQSGHWYVLLSLGIMSVPLIIMSAGKDIAYGLFDNQEGAFWSSLVFILEFCWVLLLYALICWRLPLHYVAEKYLGDPNVVNNEGNTEGFNFRDKMRQKTYRFNGFMAFALMIMWILSYTKVKMSLWDMVGIGVYVVILWVLSGFFARHLDKQRLTWQSVKPTENASFFKRLRYHKPLIAAFLPCIALFLVLLAVAIGIVYQREMEAHYLILAGSLGFTAVIFYVLADYFDRIAYEKRPFEHLPSELGAHAGFIERLLKKTLTLLTPLFTRYIYFFVSHDTKANLNDDENIWKKPFLYLHVFCFTHVFVATLFFCLVPNMQAIHPIFCILYGVSFIVFVLDWVNYLFYRERYVFVRWTILSFCFLFLGMISCAVWAIFKNETVSYWSMGGNAVLLFLCIKWLRFPNVDVQTLLNPSILPNATPNFLSKLTNPVTRWLGTPIRELKANELSVFGIGVILILLVKLAIPNDSTHNIALLNKQKETPQMPKLMPPKEYIMGWLDDRQKLLGKDSFDVYIVAGQGGGSRGAYWFSKIMTEMDALTEGSFRQQCLAMSTVSGSSVGAQGIVALWDSITFTPQNDATILSKFSHNAFQHNFLAGNLADIFFKDDIAALWTSTGNFNPLTLGRGDRNHRLQREEAVRIEEAMKGGDQKVDGYAYLSLFRAFRLKQLKNCATNAPFWSFYYDYTTDKPRYKLPLLFANTCHVQGGNRSFVSPVQNDTMLFINTFDLTKQLMRHSKSISLTSAANLSELFPYLSMASRLAVKDSLDINFVDGGYYENYGLTTAYELVRFCADSLKMMPKYKGIRLHLVAIINSQDAVSDNTIQGISQITAPVQAIMGATFGGHAEHKLLEMKRKSGHEDFTFYEVRLPAGNDESVVPLSRMLSLKSMIYMDKQVVEMHEKLRNILKKL
jgi:hypothetical protein